MTHNPFKGLRWQEQLTYATLCLTVVSLALSWRIGIIALCLLTSASILKDISTKSFSFTRPKGLDKTQKICLWAMVIYGLLYVTSAIISENHAEGWFKASLKAWFILLPLLCLIGDTAYLTKERIHALLQIFTAALIVRFVICLAISLTQLAQGVPFETVKDWQSDPLGMHHNYLALYIDIAIVFLYTKLINTLNKRNYRMQILQLVAFLALLSYLFLISSRSGIVALAIAFAAAIIHLLFFRKQYKLAFTFIFLATALSASAYFIVPSVFDRFIALATWTDNYYPDDRVIAWECGVQASHGHLLWGYGSGDYMPHLVEAFDQRGYKRAIDIGYNTHNEYIETVLQTGLFGLTVLAIMLFSPFAAAISKKRHNLLAALAIIVIACMCVFEAMLNRQMGTQFIAVVYCMLILLLRPSQNAGS